MLIFVSENPAINFVYDHLLPTCEWAQQERVLFWYVGLQLKVLRGPNDATMK